MPWLHLADMADFAGRAVIGITEGDRNIALYRLEGGIYATADLCPHQAARLSGGEVVEGYIECPGHFALFDIRTGQASGGVAVRDLATYPVKVEGQAIFVFVE